MRNNILKRVGSYSFAFLALFSMFALNCSAQNVNKVKVKISATEFETQCKIEYTLKNRGSELTELTLSSILFQDTKIANIEAYDSSGDLAISGSSSGGKYSSKVTLKEPISPDATYSFTVNYDVLDSVKTIKEKNILTVPLLSLPWKSIISDEPACSIDATLPTGMNLVRTSPRVISVTTTDSRVVAHTSSAVLVSFFRAEYTGQKVGFFTPENIAIVVFFSIVVLLIVIWSYYSFVYLKRKNI